MLHVLIGLALFAGCPKPAPPAAAVVAPAPAPVAAPKTEDEAVAQVLKNFELVHFEYDATTLSGGSQQALTDNAALLQQFPKLRVEIQGHADERGTTDYNLALGQKRAQAIKDALVQMGVSTDRLTLVSYGEERPRASGTSDSAYAENRRAEFRVLSSNAQVSGTVP